MSAAFDPQVEHPQAPIGLFQLAVLGLGIGALVKYQRKKKPLQVGLLPWLREEPGGGMQGGVALGGTF